MRPADDETRPGEAVLGTGFGDNGDDALANVHTIPSCVPAKISYDKNIGHIIAQGSCFKMRWDLFY